jgi:hypothetical protein
VRGSLKTLKPRLTADAAIAIAADFLPPGAGISSAGGDPMEHKNILCEIADGVALITVNRPASLNALNSEVLGELECVLF